MTDVNETNAVEPKDELDKLHRLLGNMGPVHEWIVADDPWGVPVRVEVAFVVRHIAHLVAVGSITQEELAWAIRGLARDARRDRAADQPDEHELVQLDMLLKWFQVAGSTHPMRNLDARAMIGDAT